MCTDPVKKTPAPVSEPEKADGVQHWSFRQSIQSNPKDLEGAYGQKELDDPDTIKEYAASLNLTFSDIINQIWHFSSVDYGPKCVQIICIDNKPVDILMVMADSCVGYNSLYTIPGMDIKNGRGVPAGKRLWTWILLFNDGNTSHQRYHISSTYSTRYCHVDSGESIPGNTYTES